MESVLIPSITPPRGTPNLIVIPSPFGASLAPGATTTVLRFRWPQRLKITEMMIMTAGGSPAELAGLKLRIADEQQELITDSVNIGATANFVSALQLQGVAPIGVLRLTGWTWAPQWRQFTRCVRAGESWIFQVRNDNAGAVVPILAFGCERLLSKAPTWTNGRRIFAA